jgi:hypothetical protein
MSFLLPVALDEFSQTFSGYIGDSCDALSLSLADRLWVQEISSVALGGRVIAVSDEFFAEAFHLLLVEV